jgi:dihydropyrimidinase
MGAHVDGSFHAIIFTPEQIAEIGRLIEMGITSFKFLLPYQKTEALEGVGDIDEGLIYLGMREIAKHRALAMVHCESPDLFFRLKEELLANEPPNVHWHDARPNECEAHAIATMADLAGLADCPLYVVHVSIREGGDIIRRARDAGVRVWAETCPQYLTLTRFDTDKVWGKINPPLRGKEDVDQLWRDIGDGAFDCIGSDHCPLSPEEKGDLWTANPGMPGIETMLPLLLDRGVGAGLMTLEQLVQLCCENPARIFGIYPQKGTLQVGSDADVVIVDLEQEHTLDVAKMHDVYSYSAYDGWKLRGKPILTMVRGEVVMEDGNLTEKAGHGKFIAASLPPAS